MFTLAFFLVMTSGLIHSIWNLFTKRSINKVVFLWFCQWTAILFFLPWTIKELITIHSFQLTGFLLLLLTMLLHGFYVILLSKTYAIGDLSQVYPIMRGTSPLLVPLIGVLILRESLKLIDWLGVLCIVIGIFTIGDLRLNSLSRYSNKAILLALSVGVMITGYTVLDKVTLQYIPPITLNEASNIGNLIALSWPAVRSGAIQEEWRINWRTIILGGIMAPGGYILFLKALQLASVAQLAPMREIGTVFGALLGILFLNESQGIRRLGSSVFITLGIILLSR